MLTISGGDLWRCTVPQAEWPSDPKVREEITKDFDGRWGDRRQEIVFIGQQMRAGGEARIRAALDTCLLSDDEFAAWEAVMETVGDDCHKKLLELFDDDFEEWLDDSHIGHEHADYAHCPGHKH